MDKEDRTEMIHEFKAIAHAIIDELKDTRMTFEDLDSSIQQWNELGRRCLTELAIGEPFPSFRKGESEEDFEKRLKE